MTKKMLIYNPNAGSAEALEDLAVQLADVQVHQTSDVEDSRRAIRLAADQGIELVIAGGGDGTVRSVVDAIVSCAPQLCLGVLPLGTANTLCRSLSIAPDPEEAVANLLEGRTRQIDVIEMSTGGRKLYYANLAHGGNSQRVIESMTDEMKRRWGAWCYMRGAIGVLTDLQGFPMEIEFDEQPAETYRVWNVLLANGRWAAGAVEAAPLADLEDGLLDVIVIQDGTPLDQARLAGEFLLGNYLDDPNVVYRKVRRVHVSSPGDNRFTADGEVVSSASITFQVLPRRLQVVVGPDYASGGASAAA